MYEMRNFQSLGAIPWMDEGNKGGTEIYGAQFSKEGFGEMIMAGGSGGIGALVGNEARIFNKID